MIIIYAKRRSNPNRERSTLTSHRICITNRINDDSKQVCLVRTYIPLYQNCKKRDVRFIFEGIEGMKIWQAAQATTAAPLYFKELKVKEIRMENLENAWTAV
jgi:patatin-like phospholipase/acyl hydrolase